MTDTTRSGGSFRLFEEFDLGGYVLDEPALQNIASSSRDAVVQSTDDVPIIEKFVIRRHSDRAAEFRNIDEFVTDLCRSPQSAQSLTLRYRLQDDSAGLNVSFENDGTIRLLGFSTKPTFQFEFERVRDSILAIKEEYSWFVRRIAFRKHTGPIVPMILMLGSCALVVLAAIYRKRPVPTACAAR